MNLIRENNRNYDLNEDIEKRQTEIVMKYSEYSEYSEHKNVKNVRLQANDEVENGYIEVSSSSAKISELIQNITEENDEEESIIPLLNINKLTLEKIVEFMKLNEEDPLEDIPKPLTKSELKDLVQEKYVEFMTLSNPELYELTLGANYMIVPKLLELCCATFALKMKGKTPKEICEVFDVSYDLTPEEEEEIRQNIKWDEDD